MKFNKLLQGKMIMLFILVALDTHAQINSYPLNQSLIGPGQLSFDIDNDGMNDYTFDILTLSPGVLAARVNGDGNSKILDNSTFGYPDTLNFNDPVTGYFHSGIGVLGTFNNAGQFNGAGNKYLGIRINSGGSDFYGWIELYCSVDRDTLNLISCGYNTTSGASILAGQTSLTGINDFHKDMLDVRLFLNENATELTIKRDLINNFNYLIYSLSGQEVSCGMASDRIDISKLSNGNYILKIQKENSYIARQFVISR